MTGHRKVLVVGDSRKMKGGVSTVIKTMEKSYLWDKYKCKWLECQINASLLLKILYLLRGMFMALYLVPRYQIIHFHTTPGSSIRVQFGIFLYAYIWRKCLILHVHVGNQLQQSVNDRVFAFCCRRADAILTLGHEWDQYVPVQNKSLIHVLYNPAPPIASPKLPEKYFLYASYLDITCKSYDTLIQGWAIVAKDHPEWKLVICGAGEVEQLKWYIRSEGVDDSVEFIGWIDGEKKKQIFTHAYGCVMTSLEEGLPMIILESLADGVPVITTPAGSLPELLCHEKNALLFDFRDAKGLASCINKLINNCDLRERLITNGQQLVREKLSDEQFVKQLDNIYTQI